ncbi:MAG: CoA transferase [Hydrocarboniphaga sp.]|uniref:CaiB/BaiF CoA transferase family protein n=1 Tax=Hydrocarboniphaga sp. TaxID=2033016 RepID=UPI00260FB8B6|nr:CaiB/BaiF CoA-transferase family protein [Hydrocarboniphaga sp.]MDB5970873.1 CoA transferase [Hydrocarboniphaga sp.]
MSTMNSLLAGVRVIDLSRLLPGPYCSLLLAQYGAEVIKVEEPDGGDYGRSLEPQLFELVNRGKRSVTLDLRRADGLAAFLRLIDTADVLLESFRPGVMDRLGCGYQTLRSRNPKLVYAALTGYGQYGPLRDAASHDLNAQAISGLLDQSGDAGQAPAMSNIPIADLAGGALHCASAILAAVIGARGSGTGAFVDASLLDGSFALNLMAMVAIRHDGRSRPRGNDMLSGGLARYAVYECADGGHVAVGALEPKFWAAFCAAVERPDLVADGSSERTAAELVALFKTRTREHWDALLSAADCCACAVLKPEEAMLHPQIVARGMVERAAGGPASACAVKFVDAAVPRLADAPKLGEANRELLHATIIDAAPGDLPDKLDSRP